ncbi:hypothetical protein HZS_1720, partial [Henneguya salminicola]
MRRYQLLSQKFLNKSSIKMSKPPPIPRRNKAPPLPVKDRKGGDFIKSPSKSVSCTSPSPPPPPPALKNPRFNLNPSTSNKSTLSMRQSTHQDSNHSNSSNTPFKNQELLYPPPKGFNQPSPGQQKPPIPQKKDPPPLTPGFFVKIISTAKISPLKLRSPNSTPVPPGPPPRPKRSIDYHKGGVGIKSKSADHGPGPFELRFKFEQELPVPDRYQNKLKIYPSNKVQKSTDNGKSSTQTLPPPPPPPPLR